MFHRIIACLVALITFAVVAGCSAPAGESLVLPQDFTAPVQPRLQDAGSEVIRGMWNIRIDKNTSQVEITPSRSSDMLLNVLSFMEPPPFYYLHVDWDTLILNPDENYLETVAILRHPLTEPENVFMGFDVRGVVFGPKLLDPDGFTPLLNPEYFSDVEFGYTDGLLGAPDSYAHFEGELWPYVFCKRYRAV